MKVEKEYSKWEKEKHDITNREYYDIKNEIDNILKYSKYSLFVQGILIGMVLIYLIGK